MFYRKNKKFKNFGNLENKENSRQEEVVKKEVKDSK